MKTSPGTASAAAMCLLGAILWAGATSGDSGPWPPTQTVVVAGGLLILATAALVGMVVKGALWGRRLAAGLAVGELGVATLAPISAWWWAGIAVAGATLALVGGPWLATAERHRAAQLGPPRQAVFLLCVLGSLPVALAAVSVEGLGGGWILAGVSAGTALIYAKAWPGALLAARFVVPATGMAAVFTIPWPGWPVAAAGGLLAAWIAWSTQARLAVQPLVDTTPPAAPGPTPLRIRSARETAGRRASESQPEGNSE